MATRKPSNPNAVAIHTVAKAANISSRELMDTIEQWDLGWDATNHMKRLSPEQIKEVEKRLEVEIYDELQEEVAKRAAARRARSKKSRAKAKPAPQSKPKTKAQDKASDDKPKKKAEKDAGKPKTQQVKDKDKAPKKHATPDAKKEDKPAKDDKAKADTKPAKQDTKGEDKKSRAPKDKKSERDTSRDDAQDTPKLTPEEITERARAILVDILEGMGFAHPRISVDVGPRAVRISVSGRGTAEILGQRNASADVDVLEALQLVVQKSLFGNDHRHGPAVAIDIMGFREGRQQELRAMANRMAEYVARTGNVLRIAGMNFIDRRAVHQGLYDNKQARTESVGHGAMRSLEVSKGQADGRKDTGHNEQSASDDDRNDDDASNKRSRGKRGSKSDASDKKGRSKDAGGKSSADKGDASDE